MNKTAWNVVRRWINEKKFYYEEDPENHCHSRKTSSTHLMVDGKYHMYFKKLAKYSYNLF